MRIDDSRDTRTGNYYGLLVRELCARPAHFLYAANFSFADEYVTQYSNDSGRVCSALEELNKIYGGTSGVINLIGDFLRKCAAQFAFSRAHRLQHGVLSPSNISISGQWLDLANVSFVNSGINFSSG
ncbi:MchC protein, partial [mine drainage metagenome]